MLHIGVSRDVCALPGGQNTPLALLTCSLLQVLFDDIGQSLIRLTQPELRFQLVTAFLQFLGLPCTARPPAACFYLALDDGGLFDGGFSDEQPLTAPYPPFSGVGYVGRMDPLGSRRGTRGHSREGEDFVCNLLHLLLPLFAGPERAQLCLSWLRYEVAKVTTCFPLGVAACGVMWGNIWGGQVVASCRDSLP